MALWAEIEKFQTLTAGIVGFAGVIFTLWYNGKVTREQRREERHHEREVLRAALITELKINCSALEGNLESLNKIPNDGSVGAYVPTDLLDDAYRSFVPRLGLLSQVEVGKVMGAYLSLRTYNAKLFLVGAPVHTSPRHVQVPENNVQILRDMQKTFLVPIKEAIEAWAASDWRRGIKEKLLLNSPLQSHSVVNRIGITSPSLRGAERRGNPEPHGKAGVCDSGSPRHYVARDDTVVC